jgi:hypothetical protein
MHPQDAGGGICGGSAPVLVARAGQMVFAASGRTPAAVLAALEAGEEVDPRETRLAEAWAERGGHGAL